MRVAISTIPSLALLLGGTVSAAEEPSDPGDVATQQLTLPGFEVSLEVPADWQVEPLIGSPFSESPHPDSPFTVRLWTGAGSHEDRAGCHLFAYSVDEDPALGRRRSVDSTQHQRRQARSETCRASVRV